MISAQKQKKVQCRFTMVFSSGNQLGKILPVSSMSYQLEFYRLVLV